MKFNKKALVGLLVVFLFSIPLYFGVFAKSKNNENKFNTGSETDPRVEKLIGGILKNSLESYHFRGMKIDADISPKAFIQYLKRVDPGKQFLTKADIKELEVYKNVMHEEIATGDYKLVDLTEQIMKKRIKMAEQIRLDSFKTQFTFEGNEKVEMDSDKRDYPVDDKSFTDNWKLNYKQAVLNKYLSLKDEQSDNPKALLSGNKLKKKMIEAKKKSGEKKLTDVEMRTKAHETVNKKFQKLFERLSVGDRNEATENFFNAFTAVYDPHTQYMTTKKKEDFDTDITGKLEGIGAVLQEDGSFIKIVQVVPGGPAWRSKEIEEQDIILSVVSKKNTESVDLTDMKVEDAVRFIRGPKGTEVRLTLKKSDGTRKIVTLIRDEIEVEASFAKSSVIKMKNSPSKVGYIKLPKFYRDFENDANPNCTDDVKKELDRLKAAKVDAVILDLRNNGGGALEDAKLMSGLFLGKGPVVQVKSHTGAVDVLENNFSNVHYDGPLIVLINRYSASASEILAGAMQDYGRAVIIGGDFSHGKGTVQAVLNFNQGQLMAMFGSALGSLKVTIQKFYRVTGASTQYKGVLSDIVLPDLMSFDDNREKDLPYSLPWDQIAPRPFSKWNKFTYSLPELKEKSEKRTVTHPQFLKLKKYLEYINKKKKDTVISLNLKEVEKEEEAAKKMTQEMKMEEINKDMLISHFEDSLKSHETKNQGDAKKWAEVYKQRKDEWIKTLQQDFVLEEAVNVANDIVLKLKK